MSPVWRAGESHQGEETSTVSEKGSMWLWASVVLETRARTGQESQDQGSQGGCGSYGLSSGADTKPHGELEMRTPRNGHLVLLGQGGPYVWLCSSTAQWPPSQSVASLCTRTQAGSDTAWPSVGAPKPLQTFSSKCEHTKVPVIRRNPTQAFVTSRSVHSQNPLQCLFSKKDPPS